MPALRAGFPSLAVEFFKGFYKGQADLIGISSMGARIGSEGADSLLIAGFHTIQEMFYLQIEEGD